jgi:hypothetical protein
MSPPIPAAYRGAIDSRCPTCGAEPAEFCLVDDHRRGSRRRRVPCVRRCPPSPPEVEPQVAPAHSARSFSEPIHQPDNTEE